MLSKNPKLARIVGVTRVAIGPPILFLMAWMEGVRVRGPLSIALAYPRPDALTVIADVLVVGALTSFVLWTAAGIAGSRRPNLMLFVVPVAASQLPLGGIALLCGRRILGNAASRAVESAGEKLLETPWMILPDFAQIAVGVVLLTFVVVAWLYNGYRRASGLEGARMVLSLTAGLIVAEAVCRLWFWWAT